MKKTLLLLLSFTLVIALAPASGQGNIIKKVKIPDVVKKLGSKLSSEEIASGLKEALLNGINKGSGLASATDGFYKNSLIKIPLPPEMKQAEARLRQVGLGKEVDKFILSLNRGAEDAAKEAKPIFTKAITGMSIQDAVGILNGNKDAATQYLNQATSGELKTAFLPVIKNSLQKVNATRYYSDLVNQYNRIPGVKKMNADLNQYATEKAVSGLFVLIAQEEANIRANPAARTSELLRKVFGN